MIQCVKIIQLNSQKFRNNYKNLPGLDDRLATADLSTYGQPSLKIANNLRSSMFQWLRVVLLWHTINNQIVNKKMSALALVFRTQQCVFVDDGDTARTRSCTMHISTVNNAKNAIVAQIVFSFTAYMDSVKNCTIYFNVIYLWNIYVWG